MSQSLEEKLSPSENLAIKFRNADLQSKDVHWDVYPDQYTSWIEEQRAWRESCILMDQSYHLANYYIEGPDALKVNADLGLLDFEKLSEVPTPTGKQHPVCSPDGYIIGDPILFHLGDQEVVVTGNRGMAQKWIHYNVENGPYDAEVTDIYSPYGDTPPIDFRFEIQGPYAKEVLGEVIDGSFPEVSFFGMAEMEIDGIHTYLLAHGMASVPGYEIFGPYEHHDHVRSLLLEAGEEYGIRQLGSKAYKTATLTTGWLPTGLPAIYESEEMKGYREWLDDEVIEANWSLGGSFKSDELSDYYLNPVELGYEHLIDLDHDFVGKAAIEQRLENPERKKVTLVWNQDDVVDVMASIFREERHKFIDIPDIAQKWNMGHYDQVIVNGEPAGVSLFGGVNANLRKMLSLAVVDIEHSEPGTDVIVVWGEPDSKKAAVEEHVEKEIRATVAPSPYDRAREEM